MGGVSVTDGEGLFFNEEENLIALYGSSGSLAAEEAARDVVRSVRDKIPELGPVFVLIDVGRAAVYVIERARLLSPEAH